MNMCGCDVLASKYDYSCRNTDSKESVIKLLPAVESHVMLHYFKNRTST